MIQLLRFIVVPEGYHVRIRKGHKRFDTTISVYKVYPLVFVL